MDGTILYQEKEIIAILYITQTQGPVLLPGYGCFPIHIGLHSS
jgi:hypothetical protein